MSLSRCLNVFLPIVPLLLAALSLAHADTPAIIPQHALWPALPHPTKDAAVEASLAALLKQMTLEEKVGQMIQADIDSISPDDLRTYKLGSILAGGNAAPRGQHSDHAAGLAHAGR